MTATASGLALLIAAATGGPAPALADPPGPAVKRVGAKPVLQVDNGWAIYQSAKKDNPIFYNTDSNSNFVGSVTVKLKTPGATTDSYFNATGIVFAPCPNGQASCQSSEGGTATGVAIGFGDYLLKAGNKSRGGWASDDDFAAQRTNLALNPGTIAAVAVGSGGAFAMGQDTAPDSTHQAIVMRLDSAGQTYDPIGTTFLPPLSGNKSLATNISKNAILVTGAAPNAAYAHTGDTAWTDLAPKIPASIDGHKVTKSQALIANDQGDGYIAGTVTVKETVLDRANANVDVGFVYDITTDTMSFFSVPGAQVIPLKVLPGGQVVGNLEFILPKSALSNISPAIHPFLFNGPSVVDLLTTFATGAFQFDYGCQVAIPNNIGELAGACIPDQFTPYNNPETGTPFYINAALVTPAFVDLNDTIHLNQDGVNPGIRPYRLGIATSIDDEGEVSLIGTTFSTGGKESQASFIANKSSYNPSNPGS